MDELRPGDPQGIGAYRLLGRLGIGGMGIVYLARSERGRTVAVKLVREELAEQEEFRSRFRREVQAARRVGGQWTAPVLDADTEAAVPWVATGYVAGPSLQQVIKQYGPLPESSVRVLASGLAHALRDIHAAGLVHRDLKPSNVMITIDGPRVIDFGIARALETVAGGDSLTHTGAMVGSPGFMSPEQVRGDRVTPACDIFCLGSVLAYAATGLQPFGAASSGVHAQMFRIVQEPPDLDGVPEGLRELVTDCLTKAPELRPELAEVLERLELPGGDGAGSAGARAAGARDGSAEPWLPGAIVAELGRHAVRLLEVESAAAPAPDRTAVDTAPPAAAPDATPRPLPPTAYAPTAYAPTYSSPTYSSPSYSSTGYARPALPPGGTPPPPTYAQPGPGPAPRSRRGALIAAVVALVVVAGGATAYIASRGGTKDDDAHPPPPTTTATATGTPTGTPTGRTDPDSPVPSAMVGVWRTSFSTDEEGDNTRTLTVKADGTVELSGDSATYACFWTMHVTSAGPPVALSPSKVVTGTPASSCSPGGATTLTLVDDTHLRRDNVDAGKAPLTYTKVQQ
ncbi:Serine/threonine protein kinase [Actinacidiphila alni]|uniref:Serine/threonine protein kinase n=1 Tax=Actinacidiphila alni TaxID=380248 RepID=A0A1I2JHL0_9ACTN|nr:serine/threonine-protein kinase [Actinacidiphila alni]SFF52306.1 Serine/threonine protein kinase [Actinacidiphila alni]